MLSLPDPPLSRSPRSRPRACRCRPAVDGVVAGAAVEAPDHRTDVEAGAVVAAPALEQIVARATCHPHRPAVTKPAPVAERQRRQGTGLPQTGAPFLFSRGYLEDYLADAGALFHVVHGRRGLLQWEGLVYDRVKVVLLVEREHRAEVVGVAHRGAEDVQMTGPEEDPGQRYLRPRSGGSPVDHDPPAGLGDRDTRLDGFAADVVDREVHTAGHAPKLPGPVLRAVGDSPFGAELLGALDLLLVPGCDEDRRPGGARHLHQERSNAAPDARDQDRLALPQLPACK